MEALLRGNRKVPRHSRLNRILAKNPEVWPEAMQLLTSEYIASEKDCLRLLLDVNFPDFNLNVESRARPHWVPAPRSAAWNLAVRIVSPEGNR